MGFVFGLVLLSLLVLQSQARRKPDENIRADFYNLDAVGKFEKIPDNVRIQIEHELKPNSNQQYASYPTRSGQATTSHRCARVDHTIPRHLTFITRYRFYSKYTHAYGIPVVASSVVSDEALRKACYIVRFLFADRKDIRNNMYKYLGRVAVIGKNQKLTQMPEFSNLADWWNKRARGLGGTLDIPMSCGGEENLLCLRSDRYYGDDIFFHEAAHAVAELAIRAGPNGDIDGIYSRLTRYYNNARRTGLWRNTYSMSTVREYFAEGAQSFFNCHISVSPTNGVHSDIATRDKLRTYDPNLYKLLEEVFPCRNTYHWCYSGTPPDPKMDCPVGGTKPNPRPRPVWTQKPAPTRIVSKQPPVPSTCEDKHQNCRSWARYKYCQGTHATYMSENCRKSCNLCQGRGDKNRYCSYWASGGYCNTRQDYMSKNCCKSCGLC